MSPDSGSVFTMPAGPAPGGRRQDESVWQFLERSTEPVAAETRTRWDAWLSRMPTGARAALVTRLKDRHNELVRAALAELVTFVLLDCVYRAVEIEPATGTGSRTDFAVDVPARTHFEVYRKAPPTALTGDARRLADIAGELEKIESPDFWLSVDAQSGVQVPAMRQVRAKVQTWLASLDYDEQVQRRDQEQQARLERAAGEMPGPDASPLERARYLAAHQRPQPPVFEDSGEGWSVRISAHPRAADERGPGQFTIGLRSAGQVHIETPEGMEEAVRNKLRQHAGLADPLVLVLDLSSPIIGEREIAAMLYGPVTTTMLDPVTVLSAEWDRTKGIWPEPLRQPARPAAVLILRGIWLGCHEATVELWLPPGASSPLLPGPWIVRTAGPDGRLETVEEASGSAAHCLNPSP
ncbi:MAG: hypothetical protein ACRDNZ_15800 [Streptosporangiaceae bacterium]